MDRRPIGIYDSGFGGLTLWRVVKASLPNESLVYLGDGKNCPYGLRERSEIKGFADMATAELLSRGCKMIVVACNTATAAAIEFLRMKYRNVEFVGMEPAIKPACKLTQSGVVGVLATQRSLEGGHFQRTAAKYAADIKVVATFGRGFVELVERDMEESDEAEQVVREVVEPMLAAGVDQIVLGCSHYPFLMPVLHRVAPGVNIIDPSPAVTKRVEQLLDEHDMRSDGVGLTYDFVTFADEAYRERLREKVMSVNKSK